MAAAPTSRRIFLKQIAASSARAASSSARPARSPASPIAGRCANSSVLWDEKSLDAFIAEPQKTIPGNTMPFGGLSDPKQRGEIVDYLKTLK